MTDLAKLVVRLEAETAKYQKELDSAKRKLGQFDRSAVESVGKIAKAAAAAASAVAVASAKMVNDQAALADQALKTAEKLGEQVDELTRLRYAAKLTADVSNGTLDMALQRMTRRLAEAARGGGEAVDAVRQLGLDAEQLSRAGPAEAFKQIADAISQIPDQGERVRLAFKLFDSEGVALVNTLREGRKGIEELGAEADRFGVTIDQKTARAAVEFNDNMTRLKAVTEGWRNELTARMLPTLIGFTNEMIEAEKHGDGLKGALSGVETIMRAMAAGGVIVAGHLTMIGRLMGTLAAVAKESFDKIREFNPIDAIAERLNNEPSWNDRIKGFQIFSPGDMGRYQGQAKQAAEAAAKGAEEGGSVLLDTLKDIAADTKANFDRALKILTDGYGDIDDLLAGRSGQGGDGGGLGGGLVDPKALDQINAMISGLQQQIATFNQGAVATAQYRVEQGDLAAVFAQAGPQAAALREQYIQLTQQLEALQEQTRLQQEEQQRLDEIMREGAAVADSVRTPLEAYQAQIARLNELVAEGALSWELYQRAVMRAQDELAEASNKASDTSAQLASMADQAARSIQDAFADFLFDPFENGLDGMVRSFAVAMQRMAAEALALQIFQSILGSMGGGGGLGGMLGNLIGGARANGGPVEAGKAYVVGEKQPELFVPDQSGQILPEVPGKAASPNVRIVNAYDGQHVLDMLGSVAGEDLILNTVRRHANTMRQIANGQLV